MGSKELRRGVDGDDSLLASVAGVPLTRLARVALCLIWAGFWAARVLLTDALYYFQQLSVKLALTELLGDQPVDQAFSICMVWLSVEVAIVTWVALKRGGKMLFAKTTPSFRQQVAETLTIEQLEAVLEKKRREAQQKRDAKAKGKKG